MQITIHPAPLGGIGTAIPSKSHAHRLLICAALSRSNTRVLCGSSSEDIDATARCLKSLCASVIRDEEGFQILPDRGKARQGVCRLDCGESGSTYRFLVPVAAALGADTSFHLKGRLPQRPMEPLFDTLEANGVTVTGKGSDTVRLSGQLQSGVFSIPGDISSQFISGLLFALPLLDGNSEIRIIGALESHRYVDITIDALQKFGIYIQRQEDGFLVLGNQTYRTPGEIRAEGDWSNAAFWLCASLLSGKTTGVRGLSPSSCQGDKGVCDILSQMGATVSWAEDTVTVTPGMLHGVTVDASGVPDLVPALAAAVCAAEGTTRIENAGRLRIKESDRLTSVTRVLSALGADITEGEDFLTIRGGRPLTGGRVDSWGDHRIAMMAAIAAPFCRGPVTIENAQAVQKSYPGFFEDFAAYGGILEGGTL